MTLAIGKRRNANYRRLIQHSTRLTKTLVGCYFYQRHTDVNRQLPWLKNRPLPFCNTAENAGNSFPVFTGKLSYNT